MSITVVINTTINTTINTVVMSITVVILSPVPRVLRGERALREVLHVLVWQWRIAALGILGPECGEHGLGREPLLRHAATERE